jgi:hypothetical protein
MVNLQRVNSANGQYKLWFLTVSTVVIIVMGRSYYYSGYLDTTTYEPLTWLHPMVDSDTEPINVFINGQETTLECSSGNATEFYHIQPVPAVCLWQGTTCTYAAPKVKRVVDKILQTRGNQISVSAIIEVSSHVYPRTLNLFQYICGEFFSNNNWLKQLSQVERYGGVYRTQKYGSV